MTDVPSKTNDPHTPRPCPHCGEVLKQGTAVLTSGMIPGVAYYCTSCRILYTPDLKLFARLVG